MISSKESSTLSLAYSVGISTLTSLFFGINLTIMEVLKDKFIGLLSKGTVLAAIGFSDGLVKDLVSSILLLGALIGSLMVIFLQVRGFMAIFLSNILITLGIITYWLPNLVITCILGRFMVGMSAGICCSSVPVYLSEISPRHIRGIIGSIHQLMISMGIVIGQGLACFFGDVKNIESFTFIPLVTVSFIAALGSFSIIRVESVGDDSRGFKELFRCSYGKRSIFTNIIFHMCQQLSGINGLMLFSNVVFKPSGKPELYTFYMGSLSFGVIIISMFLIDYAGRRTLLLTSSAIVILGYTIVIMGYGDILGIYIFTIGFALGLGPVVWLIGGEIFPPEYKKAGNILAVIFNWTTGFLVGFTFRTLIDKMGSNCFVIYMVCMVFFFLFVLFGVPETKGKYADFL